MPGGLGFSARIGKSSASTRLRRLPKALRASQVSAMEQAVRLTEADLKRNSLSGRKGRDAFWGVTGASGDELGVRSGHMRRSIAAHVFTGMGGLHVTGVVGSPLKQMRIHEEGGTIHGKPWLRIPTRVMQTSAGLDRNAGRSITTIPNTTIIKSRAGNPWVVEVGTARSRLAQEIQGFPLMLYLLKAFVKMRARRPFKRCLDRMRPKLRALFSGRFSATVRSA